ncbi:hypothetical protein NDI39_03630 [Microcoleus sp. ZQ-A2]|nr:hypothetical protein [Microcoleus sp. FACHB-1]
MSQSSDTYNVLSPTKKLSQLIAQSWLDGQKLTIDKNFLVENDIVSVEEADYYKYEIMGKKEPPYVIHIDTVHVDQEQKGTIQITYSPERPGEVTEEELNEWVNSDTNSSPWFAPGNLRHFLPHLEMILGR